MLIIKLVTEVANQYVNIHIVEYQTAKQSFTISALYPSVGVTSSLLKPICYH